MRGEDSLQIEDAVQRRYSAASKQQEAELCCPVGYDPKLLAVIPQKIIDRDYGCGDPSSYVRSGDCVVDLGSGGGKLCYIISQLVGPTGFVFGVDANTEMLALARSHQNDVASQLGYDNVRFHRGRIQDLAIDLDLLAEQIGQVDTDQRDTAFQLVQLLDEMRTERPMIATESVDCVVSNCVLNLVKRSARCQMFAEIFRVLRPGGRAAISDIAASREVPIDMQQDPTLWSGCIAGAWQEDQFVDEFFQAGFSQARIDKRQQEPWKVVNGIEFRSVTILAQKPDGSGLNQSLPVQLGGSDCCSGSSCC